MSIQAMAWAMIQPVNNSSDKFVLLALANYADQYGNSCFPSVAKISDFTALSRATIQRCLRRLEDTGYVKTTARYLQSNIYTLKLGGPHSEAEGASYMPPPGPHHEAHNLHLEPSINQVPDASRQQAEFFAQPKVEIEEEIPTPADEPPRARLFREGKTILVALGVSEKKSGAVIGRWLKQNPDAVGVLAALEYAYRNNVMEPIGYVTKLLNNGDKNGKATGHFSLSGRKTLVELGRELAEEARRAEFEAGIGRASDPVRSH